MWGDVFVAASFIGGELPIAKYRVGILGILI